jgi:hypothetical protein
VTNQATGLIMYKEYSQRQYTIARGLYLAGEDVVKMYRDVRYNALEKSKVTLLQLIKIIDYVSWQIRLLTKLEKL